MADLRIRFCFGALLWLCLYGWGALIDNRLHRGHATPTPVDRGVLGLAGVLALGGILNLCHLLIGPVYLAIFVTGAVYGFVALVRNLRCGAADRRWLALVAGSVLLVLPGYLHSLDTDYLNSHDDFHAYLVMPMRIVQLGTLQPDAFSYRAAISGPGGMAYLQAPVISLFGLNASRLVDQGCGLLLMIGASATLCRRFALPLAGGLALLAGALLLPGHALVNVTGYFTMLALLIGLIHVLSTAEEGGAYRAAYAALILAGLAAVKNTALPFAALLCVLFLAHAWWQGRPQRWRDTLVAITLAGMITLIWYLPRLLMSVQFPPLYRGDGPDQVSLSYMLWWIGSGSAWNWAYLAAFFLLWVLAVVTQQAPTERRLALFLGGAALAGNALLNYGTGGVAITRYTQPLLLVAYLACAVLLLAGIKETLTRLLATAAVTIGFAAFQIFPTPLAASFVTLFPVRPVQPEAAITGVCARVVLLGRHSVAAYIQNYVTAVSHVASNAARDFPIRAQIDSARQIQSVMVPGEAALVHMDMPFLFDFARNRISVVDIAMASPAPGMPVGAGRQAMEDYLRGLGFRYIIYSYRTEAGFPTAMVGERLKDARFTPWQRAMNRRIPLLHEQLAAIAARRPRIYDDGTTVVVDLLGTLPPAPES